MAKVLIVEDDLRLKITYEILISKEGHTFERAENGEEAMQKMTSFQPDLVLLDMMMPKMTGLEFLENIKLKENFPLTKVIVFSNMSMPDEMQKAYALGASKYVLKSSTSPRQLSELITQTLAESSSNNAETPQ